MSTLLEAPAISRSWLRWMDRAISEAGLECTRKETRTRCECENGCDPGKIEAHDGNVPVRDLESRRGGMVMNEGRGVVVGASRTSGCGTPAD